MICKTIFFPDFYRNFLIIIGLLEFLSAKYAKNQLTKIVKR